MGAIYHTKRTIVSASATEAASGYPASNVALESIRRGWRSTTTGANDFTINFSAAATAYVLLVQDVNFASATVLKSADGAAFSSVGTITTTPDKLTGRRRGLIVVNDANVKALRISIGSGTPTDGLGYHRIGALYPFSATSALPKDPEMGSRVRALYAQIAADLPNRRVAMAATGDDVLALVLPFKRDYNEDGLELVRRARAGTIGLEVNTTDYPELVLPVRCYASEIEEAFTEYRRTEASVELREVT